MKLQLNYDVGPLQYSLNFAVPDLQIRAQPGGNLQIPVGHASLKTGSPVGLRSGDRSQRQRRIPYSSPKVSAHLCFTACQSKLSALILPARLSLAANS